VLVERHGNVCGVLLSLKWPRWGSASEQQAEFTRALDRLRNALHALTKE
jgi:hypothetical protein